ncbi:FMN-binding negative transcriptional regulator [Mucilaginibacter polytrichastri]|uniref:Protease synthase and sporulation protein PAI 2 n=1 Tax=Mucilaginibacter polytrichastri TaxID=1302689 RepID=A0A1Q5ZXW8_9SPHI|nr:FMN-binding negative transcriptional regulator [Mucilaginibacter polytrichastri]OKS86615.1 Protease synthase and sporulation protein PAI 2 [Mucilaginibacter polytrichastri]SFS80954.1 negative transcriptional regulator, PaiB family [Mucilaginibacter polytrichastri]
MYVPKHFQISDHQEAIDFIERYSFGTLVTTENGFPIATHIPFTIKLRGEELILNSHIALANPQSKTLLNDKVLVIFTEPHAYISPTHYEKELSVPTWNYLAVHAYGKVELIEDEQAKLVMLEEMIRFYNDTAYLAQWATLPLDFKLKMAKGITAFNIVVDDLQGKKKLSQNRTLTEKENIIKTFNAGNSDNEKEIAAYMAKQPESGR